MLAGGAVEPYQRRQVPDLSINIERLSKCEYITSWSSYVSVLVTYWPRCSTAGDGQTPTRWAASARA